jgi:hypothetical protein
MIYLFLVIVVLGSLFLWNKRRDWKIRSSDGYTKEDRWKQEQIWDAFAEAKANGEKIDNETALFFASMGPEQTEKFKDSTNQIIQFGICTGEYIAQITKESKEEKQRKIIGYDYSKKAIQMAETFLPRMLVRQINLNYCNGFKLGYEEQLKKDLFASVSDILLIRVLEYLDRKVVFLLLDNLIKFSLPGSRFYVEVLSPEKDLVYLSGNVTMVHHWKTGDILNIFQKSPNFQVIMQNQTRNQNDRNPDHSLDRFIVIKIK